MFFSTRLQKDKKYSAKILILSAVFLLMASLLIPAASARSFMVYNTSAPAQAYFIVNGTTGNVGIGTTSPAQKLDVVGNVKISGVIDKSDGTNAWLRLTHDTANYIQTGNSTFTGTADLKITGPNAVPDLMIIKASGNVGIGTTSPSAKLDVHANVGPGLPAAVVINDGSHTEFYINSSAANRVSNLDFSNNGILKWQISSRGSIDTPNDRLGLYNAIGAEVLSINQTGNVGIGTTGPTANFHVKNTADTSADTNLIRLESVLGAGGTKAIAWNDATNEVGRIGLKYDTVSQVDFVIEDLYNAGYQTATRAFTVKGNGNVGIGTTSPGFKFQMLGGRAHFVPTAESYAVGVSRSDVSSQTMWLGATATTGDLAISNAAGTELVRVMQGGNVGIGDADPTEGKLVVNGNIGFTGATATAARVNTGSYTGNAVANRAIAHGLGVTPKIVIISQYQSTQQAEIYTIYGGNGQIFNSVGGVVALSVTAPDATNFYVGNAGNYDASANNNVGGNEVYYWAAWG